MRRILLLALALNGCDSLKARMEAQQAVSLYHRGEIAKSAVRFDEAAKLDPTIPAIQLDLGFANLALYQQNPRGPLGQIAAGRAVTAFERYLALRPNEERARVFLLQTFVDTGKYDEAVAYFKPLVEKTPPDGEALNTLAVIAAKTGRYEEARTWYEKRIEADPNAYDARLAYGVLIWDFLHGHEEMTDLPRIFLADVGIKQLGEASRLRPQAPDPILYTNLVYRERAAAEPDEDLKRNDLEAAQKFYQRAVALRGK